MRFSGLVLGVEGLRTINISLLPPLGPAAKQHDQRITIFCQINSIARTPIDDLRTAAVRWEPFLGPFANLQR